MQENIKAWLEDIERSILEIHEFLPTNKTFNAFQKDKKTKKAIERNIEIIGEAMSRILQFDPHIKIQYSRKIVDTRNRIIHGYESISDEVIWLIITQDFPMLLDEVREVKKVH